MFSAHLPPVSHLASGSVQRAEEIVNNISE